MKKMVYVLVQHSAWGYKRNPQFYRGLELRTVSKESEIAKLEKLGAALYPDYMSAHAAAMAYMYPDNYQGLVPVAGRTGSFARNQVDGLRVFVPNHQEVAA